LLRNMAVFLTVNEPVGAEYLVIESWMDKAELDQGLAYFADHDFKKAVIVGGPISNDFHGIDSNYAQRAAAYLQQQGLAEEKTVIVKVPYTAQERTYLNALMVREWFKQEAIAVARLDVFSSGVHTRRSRNLYRRAFEGDVEIGIIASRPRDFDPAHWWRTSGSGKGVAVEFAAWFLVKCCFNPGDPGSHLEKWGIEKTAQGRD
ncbi:YdcF family protein, partial [Gammaproteobacteria bacterium]|nr:YdcF family protein [Gammaproteobacteria bacterium]